MSSTAYTAITTASALLSTLYVRTGTTSSCYTSSPALLNTCLVIRTGTSSCSGVRNALPGHLLCSWLNATIHDRKRYPLKCVVKPNKPGAKNIRWQSCIAIYVHGHISCTRYCYREFHVEKSTSNHPAPPVCACHDHQIRSVRFAHLQGLETEQANIKSRMQCRLLLRPLHRKPLLI